MKRYNLVFVLLILSAGAFAQSSVDEVLASVEANNKTIQAEQHRIAARTSFYKTGLTLPDPSFNLDWMKGFPESVGNQTDLVAAQAFDFPSAYKYRKQVAQLKTTQTTQEGELARRNILLEAKLISLRVIYLHKQKAEAERRLESTERFLANYEKKLEQQDATILDVNKARLQLLSIRTDQKLLETEINENFQRLTALNGGIPIALTDTIYPALPDLADFTELEQAIEQTDPTLQYLETQKQIGETEISLTKALLLPKFEAGYRYQGLLGQNFHGIHTGITIPIWENRKRLDAANLFVKEYDMRLEEHRTEHFNEIKRLYDKYHALREDIAEYQEHLSLSTNTTLLDTALQAGQITSLEYFFETSLYYESRDRYLELEASLQYVIAELLQYLL